MSTLPLAQSSADRAVPEAITAILDDMKAENVIVLDLVGRTALTDYMIIANGQSQRQLGAMADRVIHMLKGRGAKPSVEGMGAEWVLIDAGDVIIHLFKPELRTFYDLERMWAEPAPLEARVPAKV